MANICPRCIIFVPEETTICPMCNMDYRIPKETTNISDTVQSPKKNKQNKNGLKILLIVLAIVAVLAILYAVRYNFVSEVSLSDTKVKIEISGNITLTYSVKPDLLKDIPVTWTSSDSSVASVDQNGVVTGVSVGNCDISVTTSNDKIAICSVEVYNPDPIVDDYEFKFLTYEYNGETKVITSGDLSIYKDTIVNRPKFEMRGDNTGTIDFGFKGEQYNGTWKATSREAEKFDKVYTFTTDDGASYVLAYLKNTLESVDAEYLILCENTGCVFYFGK